MFSFKYIYYLVFSTKKRYRTARLGCCTIAQYILYFILVLYWGGNVVNQ